MSVEDNPWRRMRYHRTGDELPRDVLPELIIKVKSKYGMRVISRRGSKIDYCGMSINSIRGKGIHSTTQVGIEGFSVRRLIKQNDVAAFFINQCLNPCVTRIVSKRLFEILRHVPKLYVHGKHRCFWRQSRRWNLSPHHGCMAEKETAHETN